VKHRLVYLIILTILLLLSSAAWLLAGIGVGIQTTPNPVAETEQLVAGFVVVGCLLGIITLYIIMPLSTLFRGRRSPSTAAVKTVKPQNKK